MAGARRWSIGVGLALLALAGLGLARMGRAPAVAQEAEWALVGEWSLPPLDAVPLDVALAPDGRLVVADAQQRRLLVYGADGAPAGEWPTGDPPVALAYGRWAEGPRLFVLTYGRQGLLLETRDEVGTLLRTDRLRERIVSDEARRAFDLAVQGDGSTLVLLNNSVTQRLGLSEDEAYELDSRSHGLDERGMRMAVFSGTLQALVVPTRRRIVVRAGAQTIFEHTFADAVPLDAAGDPRNPNLLHVLVRGVDGAAVATFASGGALVASRVLSPADVAPPVDGAFRWSLAVDGQDLALSSGIARTAVHRLPLAAAPWRVDFGRVPEDFQLFDLPRRSNLLARSSALALDGAAAGEGAAVRVLDGAGARVLRMASDGAVVGETIIPWEAVDFAGDDQRIYVSTAGGRVRRFPADETAASPLDPWSLVCDCDLGGRLAVRGASLYISKPAQRQVAGVNVSTGIQMETMAVPGAVGLWPADVTAGRGGRLWTADLVTGHVEGWRDPTVPEVSWRAGLLAGPRRLATTSLPDGTEIVAALLADGAVELHEANTGALLTRWTPRRADGSAYAADDIVFGADGRVWLSESAARRVRSYEPGEIASPTPGGPPPATATPSADACTVSGDKWAAPGRLVLGETARVTLTLTADCPKQERIVGADIVLVMDRSSSMDGDPMNTAKEAARVFTELLDTRFHRVGLVSYATNVTLDVPLTRDVMSIVRGISSLQALGETDITSALRTAAAHLQTDIRPDVLPVIVLLTDGQHTGPPPDPATAAMEIKDAGVQIYTVGLGEAVNRGALALIASTPDRYFFAPTPFELFPIYREILRLVVSSGTVGNLIIDDQLDPDVGYLVGSAAPSALESPGRLRWSRAALPPDGLTLAFDVRPQRVGTVPVSTHAEATYSDMDGVTRHFEFPIPVLEVIAPPPTPTPVFDIFLPMTWREHCLPAIERADVVLLVDTSSSMAGEKLEQAGMAARIFVSLLQLPGDQAAVIGFDEEVQVLAPLTDDAGRLSMGIDALAVGTGTRIDRALLTAKDELSGPRRIARNRPVVVLVSDGGQSGSPEAVAPAAAALTAMGATIFAIGLGPDADRELLTGIAGEERFIFAPSPADLEAIYRRVAGRTICR